MVPIDWAHAVDKKRADLVDALVRDAKNELYEGKRDHRYDALTRFTDKIAIAGIYTTEPGQTLIPERPGRLERSRREVLQRYTREELRKALVETEPTLVEYGAALKDHPFFAPEDTFGRINALREAVGLPTLKDDSV